MGNKTNVDILRIITSVLKEVAEINEVSILEVNENTPIYGSRGCLDSMALVALIAGIEEKLSEMSYDITIVSEKAFSKKISPFLNVKTLERFIKELIEETENAE